jgi:transcriptional regulator with XRE-family HTH domain
MKIIRSSVGKGIRSARLAQNLSQEEFVAVSGRTYISELERGTKTPTVSKVDQLAAVMRLHPLTVLTLSYCKTPSQREVAAVMARVSTEIHEVLAALAERERLLLEAVSSSKS